MLKFRYFNPLVFLSEFFFRSHYPDFVMPSEQDLLLDWCCWDAIMLLPLNRETASLRTEISFATEQEINTKFQHARFSHINSQGQKWGEREFFKLLLSFSGIMQKCWIVNDSWFGDVCIWEKPFWEIRLWTLLIPRSLEYVTAQWTEFVRRYFLFYLFPNRIVLSLFTKICHYLQHTFLHVIEASPYNVTLKFSLRKK